MPKMLMKNLKKLMMTLGLKQWKRPRVRMEMAVKIVVRAAMVTQVLAMRLVRK